MKNFTKLLSAKFMNSSNRKNLSSGKKTYASIRLCLVHFCLFSLMVLASIRGSAQLLQWNTFGNAGTETTEPSVSNNANISSANLTLGAGVTAAGNGNRFGGSNWFNTGDVNPSTLANALAGNDYIQFIVAPNAGFSFTPTSLVFIFDRSGTGPASVTLRSSADGFTTDLGTLTGLTTTQTVFKTINISGLTNLTTATTFRLYGYAATAAAGTAGFDCSSSQNNVVLNGTTAATAAPPVITSSLTATATVGTAFTYTITASNGPNTFSSTTTFPVNGLNLSGAVISGTPVTATAPGTQNINIKATNGAGSDSKTLAITVNKGNQAITGLPATNTKTYGNAPYNLTGITGGASGNAVTFGSSNPAVATIVGNTVTITGAGTTTITASQAGNANWNAAPDVTQTLTVNKASQTISFAALPDKNDNDADFALTATASSGLTVTYVSSNEAVATIISGNIVHIVAAGTTTITASQAGNTNYNAAADVARLQTVLSTALLDQEITFDPLSNKTYGDADFQLTATGGESGNPVTYVSSNPLVATVLGDMVTIVGPGTTTITASQAGNGFYNPAANVSQDLIVDVKPLTVSGASANNKQYDGTIGATISGGSLVGIVGTDDVTINGFAGTFAEANAGTGIPVTAALTLGGTNASKYSIVQPTGLTADITKADQTISFAALPDKIIGDADFNLTATSGSGLPVSYISSNPSVATVTTGGLVHIVSLGSTTITADQAGDGNYNGAVSVMQVQNIVTPPATAIVTYDFTPLTGGANNFGPSPLTPTSTNANAIFVGLTRGSGIGTTGSGAGKAWGGNAFTATSQAASISANQFVTFAITAKPGYTVSLSDIPVYNIRRSGTGPTTGIWQYQVGSGSFTDIGSPITWGAITTNLGNDQPAITLSNIAALQNVSSINTITFRIVTWGGGATGTWYLNEPATSSRILKVNGFVNPVPALPPVVSGASLNGTVATLFTTYTIIASNGPILSYAIASGTLPDGLSFNTSNGQITGTPTTSGNYSIDVNATNDAGTSVSPGTINFAISKGEQSITGLSSTNTKTYGDAPYTITGVTGGASGNAVTFASSNPAVATIIGNTVTITGAGTTTITASQAGNANWNAASDVTQTLTVNQATQTISFAALPDKHDNDADFALTATASSGLAVTYASSNEAVATIVSGNMVHIVAAGTTTITASQAGNTNYTAASDVARVQTVLSTTLLNQIITFDPLSNKTYGDADFQLTATGGESGNPVTYVSSNPLVATVLGDMVTIIGPGTTTITASQAGNGFYNPATDVSQNLIVDVKPLTVSGASANNKQYDGTTTATISGGTLVGIVGTDNVMINGFAGTFADANVNNGISVTASLTLGGTDAPKYSIVQPAGLMADITKADQTISFTALPDKIIGDADFNLTATSSSNLPVSYISSNPSVATVTIGGLVHIISLGSTTITADQAGNLNYNPAISVTQVQNIVTPPPVALVTYDFTTLSGGVDNFGPSPLTPTSGDINVINVGLTRGSGIGSTGGTGAGKAWGGNNFSASVTNQADAIAANQVVTFTITAKPGYTLSLSDIPVYNIRHSASGPTTGIWQYQVGSGSFTDIGLPITWGSIVTNLGNDQPAITLSNIPALQNVSSTNTITLRVVLWGATASTGTWYFNEPAISSRILKVNGNALVEPPVATFTGLPSSICISASPVTLTGMPANGTFTGTGIVGNTFDPSIAGPGSYPITYSVPGYTSSTQTIIVNALPTVNFTGLAATYCTTDAAVTLTATPVGGTFSGQGVIGNTFDPSVATAGGPYNIIYTYSDGGCINTVSQQVTVTVCNTEITVSLKMYLQGYYLGGGLMDQVLINEGVAAQANETDTVIIELHDATTLTMIDSKKAVLHTDGTVSAAFAQPAGNYYIAVKHRNTIQTWTAAPVAVTGATPVYNFTTAANKAFGDNMILVGGVWTFFTGDVNQDDFIDGNDFSDYDNDSFNGVAGEYKATDYNGDGFVDGNDFSIYDNNSFNGVQAITP